MPTIITHALVGAGLARLGPPSVPRWRLVLCLAALSVLPDADVVAFRLGIPYAHPLGHRGLSHSLAFAVAAGAIVARVGFGGLRATPARWWAVCALCVVATASHGLLDAATDGGLGIALFLPADGSRYFLPWRPLQVSPIGVSRFLSGPAPEVLRSEVVYVWLPLAGMIGLAELGLRRRAARSG